MMNKSNKLK